MSAQRKLSIYASLFGVLFLAGTSTAKGAIEPLSNQCVETAAQERLSECPGGPAFSDITKRSAAFKTAPPTRQQKKRTTEIAPEDPDAEVANASRNLRKTRLQSRAYKLLLTEITSLERLFKRTPQRSPDRVKLARRLAEAYVELESAANKGRLKAQIDGQNLKGKDGKVPQAKVKQYKSAKAQENKWGKIVKASRKKAIAFYTLLKDNYPNYKELDEVLYYLAFEYEQAGDITNARQIYYELIQNAPQSDYIPNAYLAFGELFFLEANADPAMWDLAEQSYREVTKYPAPKNKVYGYARYKLAYVYWNQGRYAKALNEFKKVVEFGSQFPELPNATYLAKSAVRDIIPVYAISGRASKAYGFFKNVSGDKGGENSATIQMLNDLGLAYLDTGGYDEAIVLYHDLMARDKGDRFCMYQTQVTNAVAATKSANKDAIRKELDRQLGVLGTFVKGEHSAKSQAQCANDTAALLTETAMAWHLEAVGTGKQRGTNNQQTMDLAALLYKKVTDTFTSADFENFTFPRIAKDDWPNLYKVRYAMADLLYAQKRWESCGPAFDSVVAENPKGQMAAEAAYAAVLCYQNYYDQQHQGKSQYASNNTLKDKGKKKVSAWDKLKPQELDAMKKGMLTAFSRYICYIKPPAQVKSAEDKKAYEQYVDVKFARARTYYEAYHWEEAGLAFRDIALNHSDHDSGLYAAHLYLDSMNVLGGIAEPPRPECYDGMNGDVPRFISLFCAGEIAEDNQEQCTLLTSLQCQITGKKAEATVAKADGFNKAGDIPSALATYKEGGEAYIDIWKTYGKPFIERGEKTACPNMDKVLYNAAKAYQAGRLLATSIKVRKVLLNEKYGLDKSDLAQKAIYEIGGNYQVITDFDQAADYYERYAKVTKYKGEFANIALSDAVALRLGLGQVEEALDLAKQYRKLARTKANSEKEAQIAFAVASHYAEQGDWTKVVQKLRSQMGTIDRQAAVDVKIRAHALLATAYAKLKKSSDAGREYGKVLKAYTDPDKVNEELGNGGRRLGYVLEAVGEALFFEAEKVRTKADTIKFPVYKSKGKSKLKGWKKEQEETKLVLEHINTKVSEWMVKKQAAIKEADAAYLKIRALKPDAPPVWVIAAAERVGGMWAEFVLEFRAAPYPPAWDKKGMEEVKEAYFEALDRASEPMKRIGRGAFVTCLDHSVKYQHFDEKSRACEVWLAKNYKHDFHLVDEFRGSPNRVNSTLQERPYPLTIGGTPFIVAPAEKAADKKTKAPEDKADSKEKAEAEGAQTRSQG